MAAQHPPRITHEPPPAHRAGASVPDENYRRYNLDSLGDAVPPGTPRYVEMCPPDKVTPAETLHPKVQALLADLHAVPGLDLVNIMTSMVTVKKSPAASWTDVDRGVAAAVARRFGLPPDLEPTPAGSSKD